jgi:hypothetical protein
MSHNSILIFAAIAAVIAVALVAFAKNLSKGFKSISKKNNYFLLLISVLNAIIAFGVTYATSDLFVIFWLLCLVFLVFGIVNLMITHSKFSPWPGEKKYEVIFGEIFFSIAVMLFVNVLFSLLQYYLKDKSFLFYPMLLSALAVILPLFFYYTFEAAINIPATDFHVWQYPVLKRIDPPDEGPNENLLVIGLNIPKRMLEKKTVFRAKAPENIILGELFYHFINEYNDGKSESPIQYLDEYKKPIVWWFRLKRKWYQFNRVLDPSKRVRDNFIKENSVIICEQLIQRPINSKSR